jgi:UDP-2,4-diacetamido-2,4,6-trideoxy-beta-L-altropyranose hydrolase
VNTPIGQTRFQINHAEAVISIVVDSRYRRQGYGKRLIRMSSEYMLAMSQVRVIHAYVKPTNETSAYTFRKAGYNQEDPIILNGQPVLHFTFSKDN